MSNPDLTPSIVRTVVPVIVGAAATWLLAALGVALPIEAASEVTTAVLSGAYYAAARWLEQRWPRLGVLLGLAAQPTYEHELTSSPEEAA